MSDDRNEKALALRRAGNTYREIGERLGVSTGRARQIVVRAEQMEDRREEWGEGLSVRAINSLKRYAPQREIKRTEAMREWFALVRPGDLENVGINTINEVRAWLGMPPLDTTKRPRCPCCGQVIRKK